MSIRPNKAIIIQLFFLILTVLRLIGTEASCGHEVLYWKQGDPCLCVGIKTNCMQSVVKSLTVIIQTTLVQHQTTCFNGPSYYGEYNNMFKH